MPGRRLLSRCLAGLLGALLLVEPAGAQDATTIARAQDALEAARSTRAVRALAAPELDAAERALERALAARDGGHPRAEVEHLAYVAERRAAIARLHAQERQITRVLRSLSATHALISEARAREAAAAEQRARALAQRLTRLDVSADGEGLLLTPRQPWFDTGLVPAPHALRALAEAARLLGELPEREVVVLGYADLAAPHAAVLDGTAGTQGVGQLPAHYQVDASQTAVDRSDLGCARADVVRAHLISHGVDPRRIVARCIAPGTLQAGAGQVSGFPVGVTGIAIAAERNPEGAAAFGR